MNRLLDQLYKTKLRLAGLVTAVIGVAFLFLSHAVASTPALGWLLGWPTNELGTALLSAGVIAVIFEYYARKETDARTDAHLRQAIRHEAPAIRDAVLDSFAFNADALKDIASDETLDRIATNAIGLRLGDQALAAEAYADLREQVIRSPERWRDLRISVSLAPQTEPADPAVPMFIATIRREYRVRPTTTTLRFVSTGDPAEYRSLLRDSTVAGQWYFQPKGQVDAGDKDAFQLVQFSVDGAEKTIRRTERRGSQTYTVAFDKAVSASEEVVVAYTYRALVQQRGHLLYVDIPRPTKGVEVSFDYAATGIRNISYLDFVASPSQARVSSSPKNVPTKTVTISFDGQVFPRAGVAFVWVLEDELKATK
ncbi:hypothetical protein [Amycolatopsis sp. H20-H5]|uniref:hypothetical protein n=1 Tax=Amycolatopsis sp. H20-H5 TaxID=3046309 RepID=UPI002DB5FDCE|nr:hypothetical protein [Amycolatopsis sp. H20-H5]MEC3978179.1 hypothetical protein [Amycolatopsis sp. H20-H5]